LPVLPESPGVVLAVRRGQDGEVGVAARLPVEVRELLPFGRIDLALVRLQDHEALLGEDVELGVVGHDELLRSSGSAGVYRSSRGADGIVSLAAGCPPEVRHTIATSLM